LIGSQRIVGYLRYGGITVAVQQFKGSHVIFSIPDRLCRHPDII
jgi:hypothetical protein